MKYTKDIAIFLAARSGSKRLPNKHFLKLNKDLSAIDLCIKRLKKSKLVKKIFLCTTKKKEDDKFINVSRKHSIKLFRGSTSNVLKRFIECANKNSITNIVRITADCPFVDPELIDTCIKYHFQKKSDYTSNILKLSYPDGLDVEVFKLTALIKSQNMSNSPLVKEHVTSFIQSSKLFKKYNYANSKNYSDRRWTLDYKKDFIFLKKIMNTFSSNIYFSWKEIIEAEKKNKKLINIKKR
jgi:spore coat polysaccharide biosynthesis protein SpsF (cytidylyltransferase family)